MASGTFTMRHGLGRTRSGAGLPANPGSGAAGIDMMISLRRHKKSKRDKRGALFIEMDVMPRHCLRNGSSDRPRTKPRHCPRLFGVNFQERRVKSESIYTDAFRRTAHEISIEF